MTCPINLEATTVLGFQDSLLTWGRQGAYEVRVSKYLSSNRRWLVLMYVTWLCVDVEASSPVSHSSLAGWGQGTASFADGSIWAMSTWCEVRRIRLHSLRLPPNVSLSDGSSPKKYGLVGHEKSIELIRFCMKWKNKWQNVPKPSPYGSRQSCLAALYIWRIYPHRPSYFFVPEAGPQKCGTADPRSKPEVGKERERVSTIKSRSRISPLHLQWARFLWLQRVNCRFWPSPYR